MNAPKSAFDFSASIRLPRSIWFYISVGVLLIGLAISSIFTLYNLDHQLHQQDRQLYQLEIYVTEFDALEWRAIARGEVDDEAIAALDEVRQETAALIQQLRTSEEALAEKFEQLLAALRNYQLAVDHEFELIGQKEIGAAFEYDVTAVDPAFEQLKQIVGEVSSEVRQRIERNHFYIPLAFYALVVLFLGSFGWLLWLFLNARRRSELAVVQQAFLQQAHGELEQQVQVRTAELAQSNSQLQSEIYERKQIEEQLRHSQDQLELRVTERTAQLEQSNRELEQFAYVASHDLQEPLRMVSGYLQLIERRYQAHLDSDGREFIQFAVDGANRMQQLIRDLLAYSHIQTQGRQFSPVDLEAILTQTLTNLKVLIEESQAVIIHDPLPTLMADATQIGQLLQNLLANAIKFRGQEPPQIRLSVQEQETAWHFALQDNGIGFEPQYAHRIFLIFQRLHTRERYPGTGIGLAICKRIVERHGGQIWVESTPGIGSTFYFTLLKQGKTI